MTGKLPLVGGVCHCFNAGFGVDFKPSQGVVSEKVFAGSLDGKAFEIEQRRGIEEFQDECLKEALRT